MKKTFEIFLLDWKRIFKAPLALGLVIALIILPSLYAWFNIAALWDPYSNTGDLKIAVYSDDKAVEFEGQTIAIGDDLLTSLKDNDKLGWTFVKSKKDMTEGVKDGTYYASIYIPENFSTDLISFAKGDIQKPELIYSVNQKINAIAPKITGSGAGTLQQTISQEFTATVSKTVFEELNKVGLDLDSNLPNITKLSTMIVDLNDNMGTIDGYAQEVLDLKADLPGIKEKLNTANEFVDYLPEANAMADKVVAINDIMPQIDQVGTLVLDLQTKIPEIQNAGTQIAEIDSDFDSIVKTLEDGVTEANDALNVISQVQGVMPDIKALAQDGQTAVTNTKDLADKLGTSFDTIAPSIKTGITITNQIADSIEKTAQALLDGGLTNEQVKEHLTTLSDNLTNVSGNVSTLIDTLTALQEAAGNTDLQGLIDMLSNLQTHITTLTTLVNQAITDINNGKDITGTIQTIHDEAAAFKAETDQILSTFDSEFVPKVDNIIAKLKADLTTAEGVLNTANAEILPNIDTLLTNTSATITNALSYISKYQAQLPAIKQEIHDANVLLNDNMNLIVNGINDAASFYTNDFPALKTKLSTATDFIQNDLPGIEADITSTLAMVNEKMPLVENAVNTASDLIENEWPDIKSGIARAADFIENNKDNVDLSAIIKLLKSDANAESDFLSNPVQLTEKDYYPIPNYGSASSPFYTALCLWVGAVLLSSVLRTDVAFNDEQKKRYKYRHTFYGRMLTFLIIGFFQALVVALGNIFLLKTYVVSPVWFVLFTLLLGAVFMTMVYVLASLFGNIGKGLAIILLVLSISGAGGNFPVVLSAKFFQFINPLLPFTYAVNLLREAVGGILWRSAWVDIVVLLGFGIVFALAGGFLKKYIAPFTAKLGEKVKKSKIIH